MRNEECIVMARHFCGDLCWELKTETIIPSLHKQFSLVYFLYHTLILVFSIIKVDKFQLLQLIASTG